MILSLTLCWACVGTAGKALEPPPSPPPELSQPRFLVRYLPGGEFRLVPAAQSQALVDINSVSLRVYERTNNWLRIEASPGQAGAHTPNDANQVFRSVFDSANNALHVTCISGCGGTFGTDITAIDSSHQKVVGFQGIALSTTPPADGQVYQYSAAQNQWVPSTGSDNLPKGGANDFLGWDGSTWASMQVGFTNLAGTATSGQLPSATTSAAGAVQLAGDLAGTGAVPTVTNGSHITNGSLSNSALAHPSLTVNGSACTLGASCSPITGTAPVSVTGGAVGVAAATSTGTGVIQLAGDLGGTAAAPTVTNGSHIANGTVPNSALTNSSMTVNGTNCTLGASCTPPTGAVTWATDLAGSSNSSQRVAALQGQTLTIGTPAAHQYVGWNGSAFVNQGLSSGDIPALAESSITNLPTDLAAKAPLASPALTGSPTAPTQVATDNSTKIATTAFVAAAAPSLAPVQSVAGRTGAVALAESDVTSLTTDLAAKAPLASPVLTGSPTAPTQTVGDNSTKIATDAFVLANAATLPIAEASVTNLTSDLAAKAPLASPALTGSPTAPTQTVGDNSTKIATDAFVLANAATLPIAETSVTNLTTDLASKAPLASPALTGSPTAPTPLMGDNSTNIATTAFVAAEAPVMSPVQSVAGHTGAVTLAEGDVASLTTDLAARAPLASPAFTGSPTAPTQAPGDNSTKIATDAFVLANATASSVTWANDLAGSTGSSQTVVGIQSKPVASLSSLSSMQSLIWDATANSGAGQFTNRFALLNPLGQTHINTLWTGNTQVAQYYTVADPATHYDWQVSSCSGTCTTGSSITFSGGPNATVTDNPGTNQVVWKNIGRDIASVVAGDSVIAPSMSNFVRVDGFAWTGLDAVITSYMNNYGNNYALVVEDAVCGDTFNQDDFAGTTGINLTFIPMPCGQKGTSTQQNWYVVNAAQHFGSQDSIRPFSSNSTTANTGAAFIMGPNFNAAVSPVTGTLTATEVVASSTCKTSQWQMGLTYYFGEEYLSAAGPTNLTTDTAAYPGAIPAWSAHSTGLGWTDIGTMITDGTNIERLIQRGTSAVSAPTWNTNIGGTTSDGNAVWMNAGPPQRLGSVTLNGGSVPIAATGSVTESGGSTGTVTVTLNGTASYLTSGMYVTLSGFSPAAYNGVQGPITTTCNGSCASGNTFTFGATGSGITATPTAIGAIKTNSCITVSAPGPPASGTAASYTVYGNVSGSYPLLYQATTNGATNATTLGVGSNGSNAGLVTAHRYGENRFNLSQTMFSLGNQNPGPGNINLGSQIWNTTINCNGGGVTAAQQAQGMGSIAVAGTQGQEETGVFFSDVLNCMGPAAIVIDGGASGSGTTGTSVASTTIVGSTCGTGAPGTVNGPCTGASANASVASITAPQKQWAGIIDTDTNESHGFWGDDIATCDASIAAGCRDFIGFWFLGLAGTATNGGGSETANLWSSHIEGTPSSPATGVQVNNMVVNVDSSSFNITGTSSTALGYGVVLGAGSNGSSVRGVAVPAGAALYASPVLDTINSQAYAAGNGTVAHSVASWYAVSADPGNPCYQSSDYQFPTPACAGGTGVNTLTGIPKANGASAFTQAAASDIVGLFSSCSGTQYLGADGACHTAGGSGSVTSSGYTSGTPLAAFSTATNITPATSSNVTALFSNCSGTQYLGADGSCHQVSGGVVASVDLTGQNGNITAASFPSPFTPAANGMYSAYCWIVSTNTPSGATLPACQVNWTDADSGVVETMSVVKSTSAVNAAGVSGATGGNITNLTFYAKSGAEVKYATSGYAAGSGTALNYAVHVRLAMTGTAGTGSGTVTSVGTVAPLSGTVTTSGNISCPTCAIGPGSSTAGHLATFSGTDGVTLADGGALPTGTVTSSGYSSGTPLAAFTTSTNITPATASSVTALFSGCSGTQYLGADGACHSAGAGSGTVTTTGNPASGQLGGFTGATSISNVPGFTFNTTTGALTVQPAADAVGLAVKGFAGCTAHPFEVYNGSGALSVYVDCSGNLNFTGNSATYGATSQMSAANLNLIGGSTSNAGPYIRGTDSTGAAANTYLYFDPVTSGQMSLETSVHTGASTAANVIVTAGGAQTLTNKTLTSPTLTTPNLGTPSAVTLTNGTGLPFTGISGSNSSTATMGTSAIASGTCAAAVSVAAANVTTGSVIIATPTVDPTGVTGYGPSANGSLFIDAYPSAGYVNFKVCNNTGSSITPAALTLNWRAF